jgi:hypothetical protein
MQRKTKLFKRASLFATLAIAGAAILALAIPVTPSAAVSAPQNANSSTTTNTNTAPKPKQVGSVRKDKAKQGEAGGTDANIKTARSTANAKESAGAQVAPQAKGGPKSRATVCRFHVDNRTRYSIDIYTDGNYRGSVGPWDDVFGYVEYGASLYARADFDDGTFVFWRRTATGCPMTWTLVP